MHDPPSSPVLDALPHRERAHLLSRAVPRVVERDEILMIAGHSRGRVYLLTSGVAKLVGRDPDGNETILGLVVPGDLVGELAPIDAFPQPLDVIASTDCDALGLDADLLVEILSRNAPACLEVVRALGARYRWVCDTALERTSSAVPARLAGRLLDLANLLGCMRHGALEVELPFAQGDLGRLAGMCRESTCKTLRRWRAEGMLDYRGRRLRILRPDALERIRCAGRGEAPSR